MKISAVGAAALSTVGAGAALSGCASTGPAKGMKHLRSEDLALLTAIIPAIMKGKIAPGDQSAIDETLRSFDTLLDDLSPPVVAGVLQAFDLLNLGVTRGLTTGQWSAWSKASLSDAERALGRLRDSGIGLLNAIYAALIRLVISAYFLIPEHAAKAGYKPPRKVASVLPQPTVEEVTP